VPDVDEYTTAEFGREQSFYWMFGAGAGATVLVAAAFGVLVGMVVVAQTIYAAAVDHIREYGTLEATGGTNGYIYRVIIQPAAVSGLIGYLIGIGVSLAASHVSLQGTAAVMVPWQLCAGLFALALAVCVGASAVSINEVTRIDPAMVFKG
jgi:putative ABC transport system permease protein